ncbi:hypothetical protein SAMN07250955_11414 [Arboricoccus pini]|uniref:Uncharacterized protein n=1 Tax=Arboricoccus pini TaxID=1963835 RepID=A0A212RT08_9PROT|nr:hypothetical protein [Arboricoccus pini]SNB75804.1 hypothetical protein SAMN07250955_11414 [Arboricoccus pini]
MLGTWLAGIIMSKGIKLGIRNLVLALIAAGFAVAGVVFLIIALHAWLVTLTSPVIANLIIGGVLILLALILVGIRAYTPASLKAAPASSAPASSGVSLGTVATAAPMIARVARPALALPAGIFGAFRRNPARFLIGAVVVGALTEIVSSRTERD